MWGTFSLRDVSSSAQRHAGGTHESVSFNFFFPSSCQPPRNSSLRDRGGRGSGGGGAAAPLGRRRPPSYAGSANRCEGQLRSVKDGRARRSLGARKESRDLAGQGVIAFLRRRRPALPPHSVHASRKAAPPPPGKAHFLGSPHRMGNSGF